MLMPPRKIKPASATPAEVASPEPKGKRIVIVQLRAPMKPDPQVTQVQARKIKTRVETLTGATSGAMNVFPRFGQFALEATPEMIQQLLHEPEVEAVMENDGAAIE